MISRCVTVVSLLLVCGAAEGVERPLPLGDPQWALQGDRTRVVREAGRDVLEIASGFAYRRDIRLQDGRIDFQVQMTSRRSFVYCAFRMHADEEAEEIYLRPHKSGLPDAVQYAPVYQGRSGWQLYHGPGRTAAVDFVPGRWTRVRLLIKGAHAALFIHDMVTPVMVMRLARAPQPGYLALRGFLPPDVPGEGPIARFADVTIDDDTPAFDFAAALPPEPPRAPGAVVAWSVSNPIAVPAGDEVPRLPDPATLGTMRRLETAADGLLELHAPVAIPSKARAVAALARVHVTAARAATHVFELGFSDIATVFLNGRPVFRGDGSYSFDRPRREGLIGFDQARLYLPLIEGDNEIAIIVSDVFGGWGIMGRFVSTDGLQVEAR